MKKVVTALVAVAAVFIVAHAAVAFMAHGHGPGMHGPGAMPGAQVTEDQAKALAQKYAAAQLKTLHVSPFGHVVPMPAAQRQG